MEITHLYLNPPRVPTPVHEEPEEAAAPLESVVDDEPDVTVAGVAGINPSSSSDYHFMQASELETTSFEENAEWVDSNDAVTEGDAIPAEEKIAEPAIDTPTDGGVVAETATGATDGEVGLGVFQTSQAAGLSLYAWVLRFQCRLQLTGQMTRVVCLVLTGFMLSSVPLDRSPQSWRLQKSLLL